MIDDSASFFTKQERLDRYRKVLERFSSNKLAGYGKPEWRMQEFTPEFYLYEPTEFWFTETLYSNIPFCNLDFPEFYAQKPQFDRKNWDMSHVTVGWSNRWHHGENFIELVIKWLENAIKECES